MFPTRDRCLSAASIVLAATGIAYANPYAGFNDDPSARRLFAMDPFESSIAHSYKLGDAKERILHRFGKPSETTVSTYETRWIGETQTSYSLAYTDVKFVVIRFNDQPQTFIESIEITGNSHTLKLGIRIGTPRAQIIAKFTPADHQKTNNPMLISIPTLETRASIEESKHDVVDYMPTIEVAFEFDGDDRLNKLTIYSVTDD